MSVLIFKSRFYKLEVFFINYILHARKENGQGSLAIPVKSLEVPRDFVILWELSACQRKNYREEERVWVHLFMSQCGQ